LAGSSLDPQDTISKDIKEVISNLVYFIL
jgi:hypothetical protein